MPYNPKSLKNLIPPKKGEVRNPEGVRARLNKVTAETKELIAMSLNKMQPEVEDAIGSLLRSENESTRSRAVDLYLRLLEFSTPKLQAMAVKTEGTVNNVVIIGKPAELSDDYSSDSIQDDHSSEIIDITETSDISDEQK